MKSIYMLKNIWLENSSKFKKLNHNKKKKSVMAASDGF